MDISIDYLAEPYLEFANGFTHDDSKTGLAEFGPYGKSVQGLHPTEIKLGIVGTRRTIEGAINWINKCGNLIESQNIKIVKSRKKKNDNDSILSLFNFDFINAPTFKRLDKILNRDFIGFNKESKFSCEFQLNDRWARPIQERIIKNILNENSTKVRIDKLSQTINEQVKELCEIGPTPDIIIIALPSEIENKAESTPVTGAFHLNLRRLIKAEAMQQRKPIPVQILRPRTVEGNANVQEIATRAWNFCTAQYYKAGGVPWKPTLLDPYTCYIGISFFIANEGTGGNIMRSSLALAFDFLGQGLVLRGEEPFAWDPEKQGRTPHLPTKSAEKLIVKTLNEYKRIARQTPQRIVIHKTSEFWGDQHTDNNEINGFLSGAEQVFPDAELELMAIKQTGVRLLREGLYPPLRGTSFKINNSHFLYTMGFIPYLETYPKTYVPEPWQLNQHIGGSTEKALFKEILSLTKLNMNNCAYSDGTPITISFAQKIGEIMKHVKEGGILQPDYRFYM